MIQHILGQHSLEVVLGTWILFDLVCSSSLVVLLFGVSIERIVHLISLKVDGVVVSRDKIEDVGSSRGNLAISSVDLTIDLVLNRVWSLSGCLAIEKERRPVPVSLETPTSRFKLQRRNISRWF